MRFTTLTLLALGASATAYVVNDKKVVTDNAVEARVVGSGPDRASALVAAMQARDPEPHHKGKGRKGKKNNRREVKVEARQEFDQAADDAHWADLHTRDAEVEAAEIEAREPHHKGKGRKGKAKNNKRDDDEVETREPHHKGKGRKGKAKNNKRDDNDEVEARQEFDQAADDAHWADLHTREPHHKGKGRKGKGGN